MCVCMCACACCVRVRVRVCVCLQRKSLNIHTKLNLMHQFVYAKQQCTAFSLVIITFTWLCATLLCVIYRCDRLSFVVTHVA